ncbi:hypothetical protein GH714_027540 [Hevea brasiliensis]|uniref:RIN4 pathogenic type III effector avirulence factor Avr cleavage site domain-containing protein n=1 Tax=Hevea brasiliensis TaxID=3981 RepID=A0A6A6K7B2_HEVBR|nr:hypothetical protein GH714_027540 [Hevea brasiliensis]
MASVQADTPVQEVSGEQAEKSTQETPVLEEKPATSEEAEVVVHDGEDDEDEEEEEHEKTLDEETQNKVKDEENAGSPIIGEAEPAASFDDEAEAEVEEGSPIIGEAEPPASFDGEEEAEVEEVLHMGVGKAGVLDWAMFLVIVDSFCVVWLSPLYEFNWAKRALLWMKSENNDFSEYYSRNHVPAFGSWDWNNDLPFTQCFESARQAGLLRYSYSEDRDLYVAGDLYENDVVTPAMIVVPRRRGKVRQPRVKEEKRKQQSWVVGDVKEPPSPTAAPPSNPIMTRPTPKPVDEDLYKIPPELLYAKPKKACTPF